MRKGCVLYPHRNDFRKSLLDPRKVIERKYIRSNGQVMGFYAGSTMQYQLRLTTQMPNVIELYTNNETTRVRDVMVGKQRVILRKARTPFTAKNVGVLSFLEMMTDLDPKTLDEEKKSILRGFLQSNAITRRDITTYSPAFPDRTMRNLIGYWTPPVIF